MQLFRRTMKESTLAHTCSSGIFDHSLNNVLLRSSTERWGVALTLSSNMDHIEKWITRNYNMTDQLPEFQV